MNNPQKKAFNLQKLHQDGLGKIFQVDSQEGCIWKIFVYDMHCQKIIATLFKTGDLRDQYFTLHLCINDKRDKINGVNAVYFVQPTAENIDLIIKDFKAGLYDYVYLNFSSQIPEQLFNKLAENVGKLNCSKKVKRVIESFSNFVALDQQLFTLNLSNVYLSDKTNTLLPGQITDIAQSIFSVCKTIQCIPYIYYQADKSLQLQVTKEFEKVQRYYEDNNKPEENKLLTDNYCNIVLLERDSDIGTTLIHPFYYGAVIHDVLKITNNKVLIQIKNTQSNKEISLDPQADEFWQQNINEDMQSVFQKNAEQMKQITDTRNQLNLKKVDSNSNQEDIQSNLQKAMNEVPQMAIKKEYQGNHTAMCEQIFTQIQARSMDRFFEIEQQIILNKGLASQEQTKFKALLDEKNGSEEDKLRLLLIYIVYYKNASLKDIEAWSKYIVTPSYQNIIKYFQTRYVNEKSQQTAPDNLVGNIIEKVKKQGQGLLLNVQNYIPQEKQYYIQKLVEDFVSDSGNWAQQYGFSVLEPEKKKVDKFKSVDKYIIFTLQGGNYTEYQILQQIANKSGKVILYGSTDLINAKDFLTQLEQICNQQSSNNNQSQQQKQ